MEKWAEVDTIDFQAMRQKITEAIRSDTIFDIQDNRFLITLLNRRIALEEQLYEKQVYICSPLHGNMDGNIYKAIQYCRVAAEMGVIPLASHTIFTQYLNDNIPEQRDQGLRMGRALLKRCDEIWICGNVVSQGMRAEIQLAKELEKPFRYLNEVNLKMSENQDFQQIQKAAMLEEYRASCPGNLKAGLDKLLEQTGLKDFPQIHPIDGHDLPCFVLGQNGSFQFAYCPFEPEKFAMLRLSANGDLIPGMDGRMSGFYGTQLAQVLISDMNSTPVEEILLDYEPKAVLDYEKGLIFRSLEKMSQETGARPFIFSGNPHEAPIISMPAEAEKYLSPEKLGLAKKLLSVQEVTEHPFEPELPLELETEGLEEEIEPEMSM